MFDRLVKTGNDPGLTILRLVLGTIFFAHGAQKMLGWFGGPGFSGTMREFTQQMAIPSILAFLAIAAEFFGALGLIVGLFSRIAVLGIMTVMGVAIAKVHAPYGLFMNWAGTQQGEGFEFHLLVIAVGVALLINGSGPLSIDRLLSRSHGAGRARGREEKRAA